jgi:hypothetical protein
MGFTKTLHDSFDCPKMGITVRVEVEMLLHEVADGIDREVPGSFRCGHSSECGVESGTPLNVMLDWTKCVHPYSPRKT